METDFIHRVQYAMLQMPPFLFAIVFHEFGHAFVARRHGDHTAEQLGRLTLNPIPHLDPIGTILFPLINMLTGISFLFGWAKPVPINYNKLRPYRSGLFWTAFAGPGTNIILGLLSALVFILMIRFVPSDFYLYVPLIEMSKSAIYINYALAIFNLIPLPPLDGSKMLESFLSFEATRKFEQIQRYSFFILLGLLWTGALSIVLWPVEHMAMWSVDLWRVIFRV